MGEYWREICLSLLLGKEVYIDTPGRCLDWKVYTPMSVVVTLGSGNY